MNKILVSPSSFGQISSEPINILKANGFDVIINPFGRKLTTDEVVTIATNCVGIVAGVESLTKEVIEQLPLLKCISRVGVGMDTVDLEYARKQGVTVVNTPDGPTRSVSELTLGMTLSLLRKIPQADAGVKNLSWEKQIGNLLYGKTIGVIGLGRIGKMVSKIFSSLGNTVIGYDLNPDKVWAAINGIKIKPFDEVINTADILTLHIPGNKNSKPVMGYEELKSMKEKSFIINISRGNVVDESSLYELLVSKHIAGAGVDVFSEEPYKGPLCELNNVVLTPHIGSYAAEGKLQMEIDAVNNMIQVLGSNTI
jgi:D-3-phosphoglycerate dehydrogenase / 2-oxoglutarate reductase